MSSQQPTYPQQHEPWRPDYPPVWNCAFEDGDGVQVSLDLPQKPLSKQLRSANIQAHAKTMQIIDKAMKQ